MATDASAEELARARTDDLMRWFDAEGVFISSPIRELSARELLRGTIQLTLKNALRDYAAAREAAAVERCAQIVEQHRAPNPEEPWALHYNEAVDDIGAAICASTQRVGGE